MDVEKVGEICKNFRINVLKISLTNFAKLSNEKLQNIHAFEQGRANNIKYIYMYFNACNSDQLPKLVELLFNNL